MYLAPNDKGLIPIDGTYVSYDQLVPKISEVKAELFNYDSEKDVLHHNHLWALRTLFNTRRAAL